MIVSPRIWQISIERIISQLENSLKVKNELDNLYDDLVSISVQEMDRFVNFKEVSKKHRKKFKHSKPYWSYELALAWKNIWLNPRNCIESLRGRGTLKYFSEMTF